MGTKHFLVKGMTCHSCEKIIKKQVSSMGGIEEIHVDYISGKGHVKFDESKTSINAIFEKITDSGYEVNETEKTHEKHKEDGNWMCYAFAILGFILVAYFLFKIGNYVELPQLSQNMSYGLLFLVGLFTGFHCIGMCGGFVASYTTKHAAEGKSTNAAHLAYGAGKLLSYTVIGAIFGFIGSIITFTSEMRGIAGIAAGLFLIVFGLNMLNIFPELRRFRIPMPAFLYSSIERKRNSSPFAIGLMNGLMIACGPLQAIYIMAAGTGSAVEGAKLLFVFGLGTLPVMLGFGYATSILCTKMTNKILKFSGVFVIVLGLVMANRGLVLLGNGYDVGSLIDGDSPFGGKTNAVNNLGTTPAVSNTLKDGYQEIKMDVLSSGWSPNKFVLKKGIPVKWIINGKQLTGCNNAIQVPKLGLKFDIKPGKQTIEFTPTEEGTIPFSCWMGMIQGKFIVKNDVNLADTASVQKELNAVNVPKGGSCGMGSGGGCGCGAR